MLYSPYGRGTDQESPKEWVCGTNWDEQEKFRMEQQLKSRTPHSMDGKTKNTMVRSIINGGLAGAVIAMASAIFSNQTVGSSIGVVIGCAIGGAVVMSLLNRTKRK